MKRNKGFTLIELLVVIAIIALLLSTIVPALSKVKNQAKKTVCMVHLKQWSTIYEMYVSDSDGTYPLHCQAAEIQPTGIGTWFISMKPYYSDPEILQCPSSVESPVSLEYNNNRWMWRARWWVDGGQFAGSFGLPENIDTMGSYGQNWWLTSGSGSSGYPEANKFKKKSAMKSPSSIPVIGDSGAFLVRPTEGANPPLQDDGDFTWTANDEMKRICMNRHKTGTTGWSFGDGSVEHIRLKRLWQIKWHKNWVPRDVLWPEWMMGMPE
jgi:prepilin-type N-terminal cleavage/methylation domain-containing protein